jgi:hypothetical protein
MQLILIHYSSPTDTHVNNVRQPPTVVTVKLQNTHAALDSANTI